MNTNRVFYTFISIFLVSMILTQLACKKNNDDPEISKNVWAVGAADNTEYATILFSGDGDNWIRQGGNLEVLSGVNLNDVWAIDKNTVWAVGSENSILKTNDGGTSWNQNSTLKQNTDIELFSISLIGTDNIWISGSPGIVYNSLDGGENWDTSNSEILSDKFLQGIHAVNSQTVYAVGARSLNSKRGFIARTLDAGQTWDSIVPADNFNKHLWLGVTSSDANNIVIYGAHAHYIYSNDGGQTWKNDSVPDSGGTGGADINSMKMLDAVTWWGAFDYDNIFITNDNGDSWENQGPAPNPGNMWLLGIDYYDSNFCIIVGSSTNSNNGKIIKTTDGGKIWETKYETNAWMKNVSFVKNR